LILKKVEFIRHSINPSYLLEKCGDELKTWLNDPKPWMTRKIRSIDGIVMLDVINNDKPLFDEINPTHLGLTKQEYTSLTSLMQTFGIIKVTDNNQMIPYLSFELYGDRINSGLMICLKINSIVLFLNGVEKCLEFPYIKFKVWLLKIFQHMIGILLNQPSKILLLNCKKMVLLKFTKII